MQEKKRIGNKFKKLKSKKVRYKDSIKKIQKGKWHKFKIQKNKNWY
jgi:hypothetical protein